MNIIGHKDILAFFEKATTVGRIHHAYLFVGKSNLGKRTVAEFLARQFFGQPEKSLTNNPDFFLMERGLDEKTGKMKKHISIEQARDFIKFFQGKPFLHKKKVAIIDNAELLNISAMNALLKTLEEPRGDVVIFLIASDESLLLETIRSRCQIVYFHPVEIDIIREYLLYLDIDADIAEAMAIRALGLPGRAIVWAEDMEQYELHEKEIARYKSLYGKPLYKKLLQIEDLFGKKEEHIATRATLLDVLDIWQSTLKEIYASADSVFFGKYDIVSTYNAILEAKKGLKQNVHPRLLIEKVLFTIP